jgi:TonB family protein
MRIVGIFLLTLIMSSTIRAQILLENGLMSFKYDCEQLHLVLNDIKNKTKTNFIYNDELIKGCRVTVSEKSLPIERAINKVLSLSNIDYKKYFGNSYVLFKKIKNTKKPHGTIITTQTNVAETDSAVVLTHPKLISKCDPSYPLEAIKNNLGGRVSVRLLINKEGKVIKTIVDKSSGYSVLDEAAVDYSRELKFSPALLKNKPMEIWMSMIFNYKLE